MEPRERVRRFLDKLPYRLEILEFEEDTHTAELAARAVEVEIGQIAKSLLFLIGGQPVLVVTCGDVKVSQSKLKQNLGLSGKVKLADGEITEELTGFPPGGVCPFALKEQITVVLDKSLLRYPHTYAAAGTPHSAVAVTVEQLLEITGGKILEVS
ncbi:MAG TPA: YbaK/EbsC family protein [Clostridia bacterium]|nr:YbaK/EbsC family protein [Clostridia bacterium]